MTEYALFGIRLSLVNSSRVQGETLRTGVAFVTHVTRVSQTHV